MLHHACVPTHPHPCFELCRNRLHHACVPTHPEPTSKDTPQTLRPQDFISRIPVLNFAGAALHITPRMCANPEPTFQRYTTKAQTLRFSSHTSVLNFARTALHITPDMWANPSWTNVPRHTTNFRSENVHLTHPCFELCRNRLHHACVPTHPEPTFQRYTTKPQTLRLNFANPSSSNLPRYTSQNFNVHLTGGKNVEPCKKTRSHENLCATFRPKMVLSKLQWLKLPAPNLLQKCSQEVFPRLKSFGFMVYWTRRRMARARRGAESSVVSMETLYYKTIY